MSIAIASENGEHVATHTRRSAGFVIFDIIGDGIERIANKVRATGTRARARCHEGAEHNHGDHIICSDVVYGPTWTLVETVLSRFGTDRPIKRGV